MSKGFFNVPIASCEPIKSYAAGTSEREEVLAEYNKMYNSHIDIPMYIGGKEVYTDDKRKLCPPHDHKHVVGTSNYGGEKEVRMAIDAAMKAREKWSQMGWEHRASIF